MEQEKIINIEELVQDEHNFNKGTDEGGKLMERSFKEMGAGRSVLIDKHGKIIAGNKSQKAAIAAGIKRVRVIETTGDELIAVKRTDVELESEQGRKMALLDNLTTQVNLAWHKAESRKGRRLRNWKTRTIRHSSTPSAPGRAARMWTVAQPTASWARTWVTA